MFYKVNIPEPKNPVAAMVTLNPAESRRLIAKATVELPEVKAAMKRGWLIIARGITGAYVSEELFNIEVNPKSQQTVGIISRGMTNANNMPPPCTMHVVHDGKVVENADSNVEILNFGPNDVFIKGANAIDAQGNAGIMASKRTSDLIPLCHPIPLTHVSVDIVPHQPDLVEICATAKCTGVTGVEMEALCAASVAALTIYDMCKAVDRGMVIKSVCLLRKSGGKSGDYDRSNESND